MTTYIPSKKILSNYAKVMVDFALNNGKGIKKGETVLLKGFESGKPLYAAVAKRIIEQGGNIIHDYRIDDPDFPVARDFYTHAQPKQLSYTPQSYLNGLITDIDHMVYIHSESDLHALKGIDSKKIMKHQEAQKYWSDVRRKKELDGNFSWTICSYGTEAMAKEAGISHRQYWNQIIKACLLKDDDPVTRWKEIKKNNERIARKLTKMSIQYIHMFGDDADIRIELPKLAVWKTTSGANIPSYEVFTSPKWQGTQGWIRFNQGLYRYGQRIKDIYLSFKNGRVIEATASENKELLFDMIATSNADKLGEFSLTDGTVSPITTFMADTLYDENRGGKYGNTHLALGASFRDCYGGDSSKLTTDKDWSQLGYNNSSVHTDIVSTTNRTVEVKTYDGKKVCIYSDGSFII